MKKVRWGVLSTARIGVTKVIPGMRKSPYIDVAAIASRDVSAARAVASSIGIEKAYGSYEDLLADPDIDAIYNPLPNHLHVPLTLKAAEAGKHVLCEKPMALNAAELEQLKAVERLPSSSGAVGQSQKVHIMEGFMVRHSLQWNAAREQVRKGRLGSAPRMIQSFFSYNNQDPANIRNKVEWGGGGLMDIGCYPIVAGRFFFEAEPVRVMALVTRHALFGTDTVTGGLLDFGDGRQLSFGVSTELARAQQLTVWGADARLTIPVPYNAQPDVPNIFAIDTGEALDGSSAEIFEMEVSDQYTRMSEDFSRAVLGEIPLPYDVDDARRNMRIIDALFRSEASGKWEEVQ
jgi:predicted dehydrogenase